MASLLPLLYDLLPIIMPSEVRISRDKDLLPIAERAEAPPYHHKPVWRTDAREDLGQGDDQREPGPSTIDDAASLQVEPDQGRSCEPIRLLDREEDSAGQPRPEPCHPKPMAQPRVFRREAMVGVTDKMCASG